MFSDSKTMATLVNYTYDGLTDQMGDWVLVKKNRLSDTKVLTHSDVSKHSFIARYIVNCLVTI